MTDPIKPTRTQWRAEKSLADMGVTISVSPHLGHEHTTPQPGCITCALIQSAARVNGKDHHD